MDPDSGPATIPASCVSEVQEAEPSRGRGAAASARADLITRGVVSLAQAQTLLDIYSYRLDHFLYGILGEENTLEQIRSSSPLLTAVICTVSALHSDELAYLYNGCYQEFIGLSAAQTFARENSLDDIRALCIGAFWLNEISWILVGTGGSIFSCT